MRVAAVSSNKLMKRDSALAPRRLLPCDSAQHDVLSLQKCITHKCKSVKRNILKL